MPSPPRRLRGQIRVRHPKFGEKTISRERLRLAEAGGWERIAEAKPRRRKSAPQSSAQPDSTPSASTTATDPAQPDEVKE